MNKLIIHSNYFFYNSFNRFNISLLISNNFEILSNQSKKAYKFESEDKYNIIDEIIFN